MVRSNLADSFIVRAGEENSKERHLRVRDLPRPVWMLGWVSLATDAATEAIYPLLPLFLTRVLGAGAISLGLIEGVAEAASSIFKIISGRMSDRWQRRQPIVLF